MSLSTTMLNVNAYCVIIVCIILKISDNHNSNKMKKKSAPKH